MKDQGYDIIDFYFLWMYAQKLLDSQINLLLKWEIVLYHLQPRKRGRAFVLSLIEDQL